MSLPFRTMNRGTLWVFRNWINKLDPALVEERRIAVQQFIRELCARPVVLRCVSFMNFLAPGEAVVEAETAAAAAAVGAAAEGVALPAGEAWDEGWVRESGGPEALGPSLWADPAVLDAEFGRDDGQLRRLESIEREGAAAEVGDVVGLNELIRRLTCAGSIEPDFQETFLVSYRMFATPRQLLLKLWERFNMPTSSETLLCRVAAPDPAASLADRRVRIVFRLFGVLRAWLDTQYAADFGPDMVLRGRLAGLINVSTHTGVVCCKARFRLPQHAFLSLSAASTSAVPFAVGDPARPTSQRLERPSPRRSGGCVKGL